MAWLRVDQTELTAEPEVDVLHGRQQCDLARIGVRRDSRTHTVHQADEREGVGVRVEHFAGDFLDDGVEGIAVLRGDLRNQSQQTLVGFRCTFA
ncbi:hypothetical protein D3C80_2037580 [compost metagenome]